MLYLKHPPFKKYLTLVEKKCRNVLTKQKYILHL
jgi:hypothetical protein